MIRPVLSPWGDTFEELAGLTSRSFVACSPFLGREPCERVASVLRKKAQPDVSVLVITDLSRDNMLKGTTDVSGLVHLCEALPGTEVRFLPNVHAKVYVADERCAIVTSGNLTEKGLRFNLEYGFYLDEPELVKQVRSDIVSYGSVGSVIDVSRLRLFERIVLELKDLNQRVERSAKARLRREFADRLKAADEEIVRARAEGLSQHSAFAETILFLLRNGRKDTRSLYQEIQRIHPDLCDDSIKLVIRGEVWSQVKWHQRVRHAQLYLKRQGKIVLKEGNWELGN